MFQWHNFCSSFERFDPCTGQFRNLCRRQILGQPNKQYKKENKMFVKKKQTHKKFRKKFIPFEIDQEPFGQSLQLLMDVSPVSSEYFPGPHSPKHWKLLVSPVSEENLPAEQDPLHLSSESSPSALENFPAGQGKHCVSLMSPNWVEYFPAEQGWHSVGDVSSVSLLNWPAGHSWQSSSVVEPITFDHFPAEQLPRQALAVESRASGISPTSAHAAVFQEYTLPKFQWAAQSPPADTEHP
jgi:hypothetical protein